MPSVEPLSTTQRSNAAVVGRRLSTHARVSASWLNNTRTTLVAIGRLPLAAWARGPGEGAYRSASGMYFKSVGPVYSDRGRINRLLPCCSSTWAAQPETRLKAKIGVN